MRYFYAFCICLISVATTIFSQTKNFIDLPYLETYVKVDTSVVPNRIYLTIILDENDTKGKNSVERLEEKMTKKLVELGVNVPEQLSVVNLSSSFIRYFVTKQKEVIKSKTYSLVVYDAQTAMKVVLELGKENISNISVNKTEYSEIEKLKLALRTKAISNARENATSLVSPLNQKVGPAIFISDVDHISYYSVNARTKDISFLSASEKNNAEYELTGIIEFQKIKIETEVNIKFKLE